MLVKWHQEGHNEQEDADQQEEALLHERLVLLALRLEHLYMIQPGDLSSRVDFTSNLMLSFYSLELRGP